VTGPKLNSGERFDESFNECSELKSIAEHRAHREAVAVEVIGFSSMFVIDDGLATSREWNYTNTSKQHENSRPLIQSPAVFNAAERKKSMDGAFSERKEKGEGVVKNGKYNIEGLHEKPFSARVDGHLSYVN
jgi:hypothetical protein